jgi:twitching motility protein PilT
VSGAARASTAEAPARPSFSLRAALEEMVQRGASDLHLKAGRPPIMRIDGDLHESKLDALRPDDLRKLGEQLAGVRGDDSEEGEIDLAVGIAGLGRFRTTIFRQRGTLGFAFRSIPVEIPTTDELQLPEVLKKIAVSPRGLVLVTGVTGSGKTTTLASMIRYLNDERRVNIVTVEDPIEFLFRDNRSFVSQREVGTDTASFHDALRHVLRQDPDVIMLGEIRDRTSMATVLQAADTGHLVMSTLHTTDAAQTISRVISFFPPHQHAEIRNLLASTLRAVISLRLIPRADGPGRVPAAEVLVNTAAVADRIRAGEQLHTLADLIAEGQTQYGMQTFDQSLMALYRDGKISYDWAMYYATNPSEFALRVSGVAPASDPGWDETRPGRAD